MSTMPQPTGGHRIINPHAKPNAKQGMEVDACGGSATQVRRGALATNVGASPSQIAENRCFCGATVRPYRGTEGRGDGAVLTQFHPKRNNENNDNMGCQSQFRNGTIKACMKAATGRKRKNNRLLHQVTVTGQRAFDRMLHCKLCIANNLIERGELSKENTVSNARVTCQNLFLMLVQLISSVTCLPNLRQQKTIRKLTGIAKVSI